MKTLEERQRAALGMSARLSDVEAVARDTRTAIEAARGKAEAKKAASLDLKLSIEEAKAARHAAADAELEAERHEAVLAELEAKAVALRASEANAERIAIWEAVAKERGELLAEVKDRWPKLQAEMVDLLSRMAAFAERAQLVNGDLPKGRKRLEPVEAEARGVPAHFQSPGGPIVELAKMRIPRWDGPGYAWPAPRPMAAFDFDRMYSQGRAELARREEAERNRWAPYRLTNRRGRVDFTIRGSNGKPFKTWFAPDVDYPNGETLQWLEKAEAERLAKIDGVTVEPVDANAMPKAAAMAVPGLDA
jgi:hypothetical protein